MPDLTAVRGDTNIYNVSVLKGGKQYDITGATLWMTAKHFLEDDDSDAVFQIQTPTDIMVYDAIHGHAQIVVQPMHTEDLTEDEVLFYDVQLREGNGYVCTIAKGKLEVALDVTQTTA
jgi:hypothetical protein